jgi:hypothetical protein
MKNEPVVSYDHMQEDLNFAQSVKQEETKISMVLIDTVMIAAIIVSAISTLF